MKSRQRIPHIMVKHKSNQMPSSYLFFDTETKTQPTPKLENVERQVLNFGFAYAYRMEQGKKTREQWCRFVDFPSFWKFLITRLDDKRPLYCFAHNLPFDLTIVDFWNWVERVDFQIDYFVLDDPPSFIIGKYKKKKVVFIDTLNYWRRSLADIGKSIGLEKLDMPTPKASKAVWDKYCKQDVIVTASAVERLIDYVKTHDLGQFGLSAASMAMSTFKHRFMKHAIYIHDNTKALQTERLSYYGGIVQCFFVGKVTRRKLYKTDINSMYPYVMLNNVPCKFVGYQTNLSPSQLLMRMNRNGSCAHVTIRSQKNVYPIRYNGRLCMCYGTFETYLCGPELKRALHNGDIAKVHYASFYEMQPIFRDYINYFYNERIRFKKANDSVSQEFVKLFMNMLYGKFGQLGYSTVPLTADNLAEVYKQHDLLMPDMYNDDGKLLRDFQPQGSWQPQDLPRMLTVRRVNNKSMIVVNPGEHTESFPAIAGYITSYARELLLSYIKHAGEKQVYYCDTDSLFVTQQGFDNLNRRGLISQTELGKLKLEDQSNYAEFHCPKDYVFADKVMRKGIRAKAVLQKDGGWKQVQFEGVKSVLKRGYEPFIDVKSIVKYIKREYNKGIIGKDGWITPYHLPIASDIQLPITQKLIQTALF